LGKKTWKGEEKKRENENENRKRKVEERWGGELKIRV
jgi:hypothetical protein